MIDVYDDNTWGDYVRLNEQQWRQGGLFDP